LHHGPAAACRASAAARPSHIAPPPRQSSEPSASPALAPMPPLRVPSPRPGCRTPVAKMASHAIFQYNVLAIDDTHNTWTNMIVKINIPRLLGSSDDKEKIGAARPEGTRIEAFCYHRLNRRRAK